MERERDGKGKEGKCGEDKTRKRQERKWKKDSTGIKITKGN